MTRTLVIATAMTVLLGSSGALAQSYRIYGAEAYFSLDWEAGERRGHPVVTGHVVNKYGSVARNVRLLVESLDAAGQVTASTIGYVSSDVPPGPHFYFEVPVDRAAARYRVNVLSWEWRGGPSG